MRKTKIDSVASLQSIVPVSAMILGSSNRHDCGCSPQSAQAEFADHLGQELAGDYVSFDAADSLAMTIVALEPCLGAAVLEAEIIAIASEQPVDLRAAAGLYLEDVRLALRGANLNNQPMFINADSVDKIEEVMEGIRGALEKISFKSCIETLISDVRKLRPAKCETVICAGGGSPMSTFCVCLSRRMSRKGGAAWAGCLTSLCKSRRKKRICKHI